ncbi:hypothetical protein DCAR_0832346 [Daucus carota subsp. sativus]|uniref:hAT-like transposase RNase-H fold domain-containing protein n=1 Tax=Daucus carota subsp. sativus TaxID=79200 RepID=A0AAF0XT40_DAUCS|nr:hypothetical protein DCAR_0832346 [Daucus carota subsp. sativus]
MDDSHITVRSFADESFSDEDVEQEEVSKLSTKRKRDVQDVAANENRNSEEPEIGSEKDGSVPVPETSDQPFQKKPKKKTSGVWEYMDTINVKGVERYKCTLCSKLFLKSKTSSTSSMKRHLEKCVKAHSGTLQPQLQVRRDGLKPIMSIVSRVRDGIKYIGFSEGRRKKWAEISELLQIKPKKLILDVSTRWNTTYHMLYCGLQFKQVFPRYAVWDKSFREYVPSEEDWVKVGHVCSLLRVFDDATRIVSGSEYPTSNLFLSELKRVKELLDKKVVNSNSYMREMAGTMQEKFDKYWGESNLMMSIGAVMDPRFKMKLISFCFPIIYPLEGESEKQHAHLKVVLNDLYQEYVAEDYNV